MLSVDEAREMVEDIRVAKGDDEMAHSWEDTLYERVLRTIAESDNIVQCQELAKIALETKQIDFARWCA